jgi:hypothetical protein
METWKDIKGYENVYKISSLGRVIRKPWERDFSEKEIKHIIKKHGYAVVGLNYKKQCKYFYVHRLIAIAFIENLENKPQVNHKDGNKLNNVLDNLEWATRSENQKHRYTHLGHKNYLYGKTGADHKGSKPVMQMTKDGIYLKTYAGVSEAGRQTGVSVSSIVSHIKGRLNHAGGYLWDYVAEQVEKENFVEMLN